jgi:hypothetical protein
VLIDIVNGNWFRVIPGGPMVFMCMNLESGGPKTVGVWGPEQIAGWGLTVALEGGFWRVSGRCPGEQWPGGTHYLDLPWAPIRETEH